MILELLRQHFGLVMLATLVVLFTTGFPVAFTLMGTAVAFALLGNALGFLDARWLSALALRLLGLMNDDLLQAVPIFIYLGVILQRTTLSTELLSKGGGSMPVHGSTRSPRTDLLRVSLSRLPPAPCHGGASPRRLVMKQGRRATPWWPRHGSTRCMSPPRTRSPLGSPVEAGR